MRNDLKTYPTCLKQLENALDVFVTYQERIFVRKSIELIFVEKKNYFSRINAKLSRINALLSGINAKLSRNNAELSVYIHSKGGCFSNISIIFSFLFGLN